MAKDNDKEQEPESEVVEGSPEKDFFIDMITKDIPLDAYCGMDDRYVPSGL